MQKHILEYLENTVLKYGDKVAYRNGEEAITFSQVRHEAKKLSCLISEKTQRNQPVVIVMEKSIQTIIAYLAVLYSGCFYIPLDGELPDNRMQDILSVVGDCLIIADRASAERVCNEENKDRVIVFEDAPEGHGDDDRYRFSCDTDPMYVIFTSGSTGKPKGVVTSHHAAIDYIDAFAEAAEIDDTVVFGNQAPLDYVAAVRDIYLPLKCGATSVLIAKKLFTSPKLLFDLLEEYQVNTICWVVSALCIPVKLNAFKYKVPALRKVIFTGAAMPCKYLAVWQQHLPDALYINHYGPTEITASCTWYKVDHPVTADEVLPIGLPYNNTEILLLDSENRLVTETGAQGELCVRGSSLALGYYGNPELTQKSFQQNPLHSIYRDLIYRTGDIGSWGEDGLLHFHGRMDTQIKFMGHRVELGEVEIAARAMDGVEECCCFYHEEKETIWLFVESNTVDPREVTAHLKGLLPTFMVPRKIVVMEKFPLQFNGKIDRVSLKQQMK